LQFQSRSPTDFARAAANFRKRVSGYALLEPDERLTLLLLSDDVPTLVLERPSWMAFALCRGSDADFFASEDAAEPAKSVCVQCPCREPCLSFALGRERASGAGRRRRSDGP
jgi:hypothetical protein